MKNFSLFSAVSAALCVFVLSGCGEAPAPAPVLTPEEAAAAAAAAAVTNFEACVQAAVDHIARGEVDAACARAREALEIDPTSAEARLADAQAAYLKKDYARAAAGYAAVAKDRALPAELRSQAFVENGVVELAQNNFDAARISFLRGMRANRRNPAAWYHLALLSRNTYHLDHAAREQYAMAARLSDPKDARTKKITREIIPALNDAITRAAAAVPGVAARDPAACAKALKEAEALLNRKMTSAALKKYKAAYEADPLSYDAAFGWAQLLAKSDKTPDGVKKVQELYRAASDLRPSAQTVYREAASYAYANKRWAVATSVMERAIAHDPENKASVDLLVGALLKSGRTADAEAWKAYRSEL